MTKSRKRTKTARNHRKPDNPEEDDVPNIIEEPLRVIPVRATVSKKRKTSRRQKTR